ncbi:hypothetical protein KIN20_037506 [Parelaphostrongylus tenuis]|uniref:Reverse transcriptase domain-containing protein n=1 Tax=Parelaphostrongylus tenuis TaxID=148309 RepID=A0AAD5REP8_PARTN|nr:hypothetical protein KIN20_037506 [Parelaphostrongylus tenuis]
MGQRLKSSLDIAFMSKVETPVLHRRPILYFRYVDDCFIICSTQEEMDKCYEFLNGQKPVFRVATKTSDRPASAELAKEEGKKKTLLYREKPPNDRAPQLRVQSQFQTAGDHVNNRSVQSPAGSSCLKSTSIARSTPDSSSIRQQMDSLKTLLERHQASHSNSQGTYGSVGTNRLYSPGRHPDRSVLSGNKLT